MYTLLGRKYPGQRGIQTGTQTSKMPIDRPSSGHLSRQPPAELPHDLYTPLDKRLIILPLCVE